MHRLVLRASPRESSFFFFNDTATTEIYTLSLHDALPICDRSSIQSEDVPGDARHASSPQAGGSGRDCRLLLIPHLAARRSEEHTSELHHQIISYAVFCLKKKNALT